MRARRRRSNSRAALSAGGLSKTAGKERPRRLVLAGPVGRPEAVRRQQRLARVVTGVVGNAVPDDDTGEQRQLVQALLGLAQERGRTRDVCGDDIESSRLDQREDRRLLDAGERSQRHGSSPITATAGPLRTLSRNPEGAANSSGVRMVGFTGRCTAASTRVHAS